MVKILAIETSCDETAAAVVADGKFILSNCISSQIPVHRLYGGVVPEIASRCHLEAITPIVNTAMREANCVFADLDAIAVSSGPGLVGALLVGVSYAKALAMATGLPLLGVHHWHGHITAPFLEHERRFPFTALVVSGSHSGIVEAQDPFCYRLLGESLDDAAGEAFDKIARALGLSYPGGPAIQKAAQGGNRHAVAFPRAFLKEDGHYDFSFSGLKSAVLNYLNRRNMQGDPLRPEEVKDVAASAQEAICDVLAHKAVEAAHALGHSRLVLAGGVAANGRLRELVAEKGAGLELIWPSSALCTDNAAMIAAAAYDLYQAGRFANLTLNANPRQKFYQ